MVYGVPIYFEEKKCPLPMLSFGGVLETTPPSYSSKVGALYCVRKWPTQICVGPVLHKNKQNLMMLFALNHHIPPLTPPKMT